MTTMNPPETFTPVECPTLTPERQLLWDAANRIEEVGLYNHAGCHRIVVYLAAGAGKWRFAFEGE